MNTIIIYGQTLTKYQRITWKRRVGRWLAQLSCLLLDPERYKVEKEYSTLQEREYQLHNAARQIVNDLRHTREALEESRLRAIETFNNRKRDLDEAEKRQQSGTDKGKTAIKQLEAEFSNP